MSICSGKSKLRAAWLVSALGLAACATDPVSVDLPATLGEPERAQAQRFRPPPQRPQAPRRTRVERLPGLTEPPAAAGPGGPPSELALPPGELVLNADALPLNRFIHLALAEVLGLPVEMDPGVATRTEPVTLHLTRPVEAQRLLETVKDVLSLYDVALVQGKTGVRVLPEAELRSSPPEVARDRSRALIRLGRVMEYIPLRYATPGEAIGFARHFLQVGTIGDVQVNTRLNGLLVVGDATGVARFARAVALVDRPAMQGHELRLIYPAYWQVNDLLPVLQQTLEAEGVPVAAEGKGNGLHLIPVKEINTLIVASPQSSWLDALLALVRFMDAPQAIGAGKRHFIYFVKNARAEGLGAVIAQVLSGKSGAVGAKRSLEPLRNATEVVGAGLDDTPAAENPDPQQASADTPPQPTLQEAGDLAVVTDEARNALIFIGTADAYREVLPLLEQLDKPPRQVLIEATIAEVKLDDSTQFGVEAALRTQYTSGDPLATLSTVGGLGLGSGGLNFTLLSSAGEVQVRLNALATEGKARILSSPRLLAMDNEPARIQIGDQVAILSQERSDTTAADSGVLRNFTYVDTGVILELTPTINEGGVVELTVHQEVSVPGASINNTPPITQRSVDTTLVAQSGQTVLIGGLISNIDSIARNKVPLLGDIPLLGYLFSSEEKSVTATELIVLITPHIVSGPDDADYLTRAFRDQLGWDEASAAAP